jgi:hypothetical protein
MTAGLIVLGAAALGAAIGRWWALALPLVGVAVFAVAEVFLGPGWAADTPVVAVAVVSEAAMAAGIFLRHRAVRPAPAAGRTAPGDQGRIS